MNTLNGRCDRNVGLKSLVIQSCRVHKVEYVSGLLELVKEVNWGNRGDGFGLRRVGRLHRRG